MKPFTSIESFRHAVGSVKKYCADFGKALPTVDYVGTVKLHGTNAGVRVSHEGVQPQKRTDIVTVGQDNAGFAAFCHDKEKVFREIASAFPSGDFTLYGEWCGGNIQKNVAITELPRHFVIFAGYDAVNDRHYSANEMAFYLANYGFAMGDNPFNTYGVFFITQIPAYHITIDYSRPEDALAKLEEYTLAVEEECPWGKFRGVSGVGEGIVWAPASKELSHITGLWFKTKGMKHAAKDKGKKATNIAASPEKLESIRAVVEAVLPVWRLEQGISKLKEDGKTIEPQSTGDFLKWVSQDILKEDTDIIVANGFDWKALVPYIMREARQWYMKKIDEEAFATE
jgi:hypothetical protein